MLPNLDYIRLEYLAHVHVHICFEQNLKWSYERAIYVQSDKGYKENNSQDSYM